MTAPFDNSSVCNTIKLKGEFGHHLEDPCGVITTPGMLVEEYDDAGTRKMRPHTTSGGKTSVKYAKEDALQGFGIGHAYAVTDQLFYYIALPGDEFNGLVPANAAAITRGDKLISNGDGTFIKPLGLGSHTLYDITAASSAVTNSTVETAFSNGSYTVPANTFQVGDVLTMKGQVIATATHSTDTLKIKVYQGTNVLADSGALDVADNNICEFEIVLTIRTIGASGTYVADGFISIGTPGTATPKILNVASTVIDTTAGQALAVKATWSVADAGNSCRLDLFDVELSRVNPAALLVEACVTLDNSAIATPARLAVRVL